MKFFKVNTCESIIFPEMGQKTSNLLEQRIFRTELEINSVPAQKIASVLEIARVHKNCFPFIILEGHFSHCFLMFLLETQRIDVKTMIHFR